MKQRVIGIVGTNNEILEAVIPRILIHMMHYSPKREGTP